MSTTPEKKTRWWTCQECGKTFTSNTGLYYHMPLHTGKWKHTCDLCDKGFMESTKYRKHMEMHRSQIQKIGM